MEGIVKSFNQQNGFGFVTTDELNKDVFLSQAHISPLGPDDEGYVGRRVRFTLHCSPKGPQAREVQWLSPPSGRFSGILKNLQVGDSYGSLECSEAYALYKRDVWIKSVIVPDEAATEPVQVLFTIVHNKQGQPLAEDVEFLESRPPSAALVGKACRW